MRDAESMLDQLIPYCNGQITAPSVFEVFAFVPPKDTEKLMGYIISGDLKSTIKHVEDSLDAGRDAETMLYDLAELANNLLLAKAGHFDSPPEIEEISAHQLADFSQILSGAKSEMQGKTSKRTPLLTAVIHAIQNLHEADTDDVLEVLAKFRDTAK